MQTLNVTDWLLQCGKSNVQKVSIAFETPKHGIESRECWRYSQTLPYTHAMDAVRHGDRKAGDTYTETLYYCLGELPIAYVKHRDRVCFSRSADNLDYYVAAYVPAKLLKPAFAEFHPFGANFLLKAWDLTEKIDQFEPKPYRRFAVEIV